MCKRALRDLYDSWYENNRSSIINGKWKLVNKKILSHPKSDCLRGLNIIGYLSGDINKFVDKVLLPRLLPVVDLSGWIIPAEGRHVTVLDIIPHNSDVPLVKQKVLVQKYNNVVQSVVSDFDSLVRIELNGIFASPNGITIQGFPVGEGLSELRDKLRKGLGDFGLTNLEKKKYAIQTAHVALIKFVAPLDGQRLLSVVDSLRDFPIGTFDISELVLNFSSRYDKFKTIEVVAKYLLEKK